MRETQKLKRGDRNYSGSGLLAMGRTARKAKDGGMKITESKVNDRPDHFFFKFMIDQNNKLLLLIKEYWAYSISIVLFVIAFSLLVMAGDIKMSPFFLSLLLAIFIVLIFVNCLLVINIRHLDETKNQLLKRYCKFSLVLPALLILQFLINIVSSPSSIDRDWSWLGIIFVVAGIFPLSVALSVVTGLFTRFVLTVRSNSIFFSLRLRIITVQLLIVLMLYIIVYKSRP